MQHATKELLQVLGTETYMLNSFWTSQTSAVMPEFLIDCIKGPQRVRCKNPEDREVLDRIAAAIFLKQLALRAGIDTSLSFNDMMRALALKESDIRPGGKYNAMLHISLEQVLDAASVVAQAQKIAKDGIHEFSITGDQALGLADMKFNLDVDEYMMPAGSVIVHIPQEIYKLDRFGSLLPELRLYLQKSWEIRKRDPMFDDEDAPVIHNRDLDAARRSSDKGGAISVLVQKFDGPQHAMVVKFILGNAHITMVCNNNSIETPGKKPNIEECFAAMNHVHHLEDVRSPKIFDDLHRIALSAVLVSTIRPGLCHPRTMDYGVAKDRARFIEGLGKKTPLRVEHASYFILQPEMKTYSEKSEPSESGLREAPDKVIIKPVFVHGHFRRQPYGPKRTLRRIQWIKCSIRNRRLLIGDNPPIVTAATFTQPTDVIKDIASASKL